MNISTETIQIRPYNLTELARMYHMTPRTMKKWLLPHRAAIGNKVGQFYNINQVKAIFSALGTPENKKS